jgi:peptidoglycan-N-acetylglucosamine deacetylase
VKLIFSAALCLLLLNACKPDIPKGELAVGYIALTFDDSDVDGWYKQLSLFDSLGIKATFYVSNYGRFSKEQVNKLHEIEGRGHEIAFHSSTHPNLEKLSKQKGIDYVIETEIVRGIEKMKQDGFNPVNFAYPYGRSTQELHNRLYPFFNSLRIVGNKNNYTRCLVPKQASGQVLYGCPVDQNSFIKDLQIKALIRNAAEKKLCAVLYGHEIGNDNYAYSLPLNRLKMIAEAAKQDHVKFITVREITK